MSNSGTGIRKSKFSREYLNKDRNYWFVCRYNNTDISNNALLSLYGNLRRYSSIWLEMSEDIGTRNTAHYRERHRFMNGLANLALTEIEQRAREAI